MATQQGAVEDTINFVNTYPDSDFIICSRYLISIAKLDLPHLEMANWDQTRIKNYLCERLGAELGTTTFTSLGDDLDFEWMQGYSLTGLCSNPLTLWMIATDVEAEKKLPQKEEELVSSLVDSLIKRTPENRRHRLSVNFLKTVLENLAYSMVERGYILSMPYEDAIDLITHLLMQIRSQNLVVPDLAAVSLLDSLSATGLLYRNGEQVLWLHQVIQEALSVAYSNKRFEKVHQLSNLLHCPACNLWPDGWYFEEKKGLWGNCSNTAECKDYQINLPEIPENLKLRAQVQFIDHTGSPHDPNYVYIPNGLFDDGWMRFIPNIGLLITMLSYSQNNGQEIMNSQEIMASPDTPELLANLIIWMLAETGILILEHSNDLTTIHIHPLPSNPAQRLEEFVLKTVRELTLDELEEDDPENRIKIVHEGYEERMQERRRKNLPIYNWYPFLKDEKQKVFRIAQKVGGQILRRWGGYEEIIAEFQGEAWDLTGYNTEE